MQRVSVSLPDHVHAALARVAEANHWSLSKAAAVMIERRLLEKNPTLVKAE